MAEILYGAPVKEIMKERLIEKVNKLERKPVLAIVQVGDRPDSNIYIKNKVKFGEEIGVNVLVEKFEESISESVLVAKVQNLVVDKNVDGIIVQLPLPQNIDSEKIINLIPKNKDADGLSCVKEIASSNIVTPATARAVLAVLDHYQVAIKNKKVVVIGRSKLAGGPIAQVLIERGGEVMVCHRGTELSEMIDICKKADILVSAAGQAGLVTRDFVNERQVVVDVGINRVNGRLVGDVAFAEVEPIVASITPVPGGIGPLTVACLFENLLDLSR